MRERVYKVNRQQLNELNRRYRPSYIQSQLRVSPQVWYNYRSGVNDVPESIVDRLCEKFGLVKQDLALQ